MKTKGFTLIELIIVIAIVAILAVIAIPSFQEQVRKSRRAEAMRGLGDFILRQERWRSNHTSYGTYANLGSPAVDNYNLAVTFPSTGTCPGGQAKSNINSYIITATSKDAQASDTKCATLVITSDCGTISKTSTGGGTCW